MENFQKILLYIRNAQVAIKQLTVGEKQQKLQTPISNKEKARLSKPDYKIVKPKEIRDYVYESGTRNYKSDQVDLKKSNKSYRNLKTRCMTLMADKTQMKRKLVSQKIVINNIRLQYRGKKEM